MNNEAQQVEICVWKYSNDEFDFYETSCGYVFTLIDGTPINNDMIFCFHCGKRLEESKEK